MQSVMRDVGFVRRNPVPQLISHMLNSMLSNAMQEDQTFLLRRVQATAGLSTDLISSQTEFGHVAVISHYHITPQLCYLDSSTLDLRWRLWTRIGNYLVCSYDDAYRQITPRGRTSIHTWTAWRVDCRMVDHCIPWLLSHVAISLLLTAEIQNFSHVSWLCATRGTCHVTRLSNSKIPLAVLNQEAEVQAAEFCWALLGLITQLRCWDYWKRSFVR